GPVAALVGWHDRRSPDPADRGDRLRSRGLRVAVSDRLDHHDVDARAHGQRRRGLDDVRARLQPSAQERRDVAAIRRTQLRRPEPDGAVLMDARQLAVVGGFALLGCIRWGTPPDTAEDSETTSNTTYPDLPSGGTTETGEDDFPWPEQW